ncbi:ergothioneine biosynthesis glutamate--cysteine ligase EgtA [Pseudonocardia benzenivorans]|uniref:ergothioneine biosynthesis glutamate--cysteine ligase EgtA n=1 Tax=Pseudonocardia benzenivorans TaxID=228005 RepID=UPI0031F8E3AD
MVHEVEVAASSPSHTPAAARQLRSLSEAEAYVASVCFKHGPPRLQGVELEWLVHSGTAPGAPPDRARLASALGPHAPTTLVPSSPAQPLPHGSTVTVEPGGQVELASPPLADLGSLVRVTAADAAELHRRLAACGLVVQPRATDPLRPPTRILDHPRYAAMERAFDRRGPHGRSGMCSTTAVQVCLDVGTAADLPLRWETLHALGPVLLAAFANSPVLAGRRTGWKSSRMACWLSADPTRTTPPRPRSADPVTDWAARVLGTPLLCVRRDDGPWDAPPGVTFADWIAGALPTAPTTADLDYHVSTLFPPVRAHGFLEVRYVDGQAGSGWALPIAVLVALLSRREVTERALELSRPVADRWIEAARCALADPALAAAAGSVFELACAAAREVGAPADVVTALEDMTARRVLRGRCPADDLLDEERLRPQPVVDTGDEWPLLTSVVAPAALSTAVPEGDPS